MVRDEQQIDEFLNALKIYWKNHPDYRFGQIVANGVREITGAMDCDPFHVQDEEFLSALRQMP